MTLIVCDESLLCCHLIIAIIIVIENNCFVRKKVLVKLVNLRNRTAVNLLR